MSDAYWRYSDARQQQQPPISSLPMKRARPEYDIPGGHELPGYFPRDDGRAAHHAVRDSDSIGASYDRYLRSGQIPSYAGGEPGRPLSGPMGGYHVDDVRLSGLEPAAEKGQGFGIGSGKSALRLPSDATNTLFVEGLPANCTKREVSHIFRPFVGFKEVRLVNKEARRSGDQLVLCFVDFGSAAEAATALDAIQGYTFDLHDRDSASLKLQFARHPGPRSGGGGGGGGGGGRPRARR